MKKVLLLRRSLLLVISLFYNTLFAHIGDHQLSKSDLSSKKSLINRIDIDLNKNPSLCAKETLMVFFPQLIVKAVLMQYGVNEEKAEKIAKELAQKDQIVVQQVEIKASKMDPNPLNNVNQRDVGVKIFGETLYEVFASVLKENQAGMDDQQIQVILDDIREIKGKLFVECIKREQE